MRTENKKNNTKQVENMIYSYISKRSKKEMGIPMEYIKPFIAQIGQYRCVSKTFVEKSDIKYVKFLWNAGYVQTYRLMMDRPSLEIIVFERSFVTSSNLKCWMQKKPNVHTFVLYACSNVSIDGPGASFLLENPTIDNVMTVMNTNKKVRFYFHGCWGVFNTPEPFFSPEDVVLSAVSALNHASLSAAKSFFLNRTLLSLCLDSDDFFFGRCNDVWKVWKGCVIINGYAVVIMTVPEYYPLVWLLVQHDNCWKIKRVGEMSIAKAWKLMSCDKYKYYNPIDTCNKRVY